MTLIKYAIAKIRLVFASASAKASKNSMNKVIKNSRAATEEIEDSYENFLMQCKKQEKAKVELKKIQRRTSSRPILDTDLGIIHYIVSPQIADDLTRFDIEMAVTRHRYGDWGKVTPAQWLKNNEAVLSSKGDICSKHSLHGKGYFVIVGKVGSATVNVKECVSV